MAWPWSSANPRVSYAWALERYAAFADAKPLTWQEQDGLRWARELAGAEILRREGGPDAWPEPPLTAADIAAREAPHDPEDDGDLTERDVVDAIAAARLRMFGRIKMASIRRRALRAEQRGRERRATPPRCKECDRLLPNDAPRNRQLCDLHRSDGARVRRHRER